MMETVVVSQLGARMHYAVPRIFHEAGQLERLYTDICGVKGWPAVLEKFPKEALPAALRRLSGRVPLGIPNDRIECFAHIGLSSVLRRTLSPTRAQDTRAALIAARQFSRSVVTQGFGEAGGFYGISGECLEQIEAAHEGGLWTAVEQIIAPRPIVDRLVAAEVARHPDWEPDVENDPYAYEFAAREMAEWFAADIVICPSEFVREGVRAVGGPVERCVVVPYGIDGRFSLPARACRRTGPLRVLTVGAVGLRKGTPYVLDAARRLKGCAEFRLVGSLALSAERQTDLSTALDLTGPTPRAEMGAHYAWADVFMLPSVCEGSATVVYEAMAAGLPVVTTPNTGSVIRDGVDGYLVDVGDADAICQRLETLAGNRDLLESMAIQARDAAQDYDLAGYGRRLLSALAPLRVVARSCGVVSLQEHVVQ